MALQRAASDLGQEDSAVEAPMRVGQHDAIVGAQPEVRRVLGMHVDVIARGAGQRNDLALHQGVELLAAARGESEAVRVRA